MNDSNTEDILAQIRVNEKRKKTRTVVVVLITTLAGLAFILYSSTSISKTNKKNEELSIAKDSLLSENTGFRTTISKKDSIKKLVDIFLGRKKMSVENISALFADTLVRYYTFIHPSRTKIVEDDIQYWKKYPDESFALDSTSYNINTSDSTNLSALIRGVFCRTKNECKELFQEIKFDGQLKINYVRAYFVTKE